SGATSVGLCPGRERGGDARDIEPIPAELLATARFADKKHRHCFAKSELERRIGIDVDDTNRCRMRGGERPQRGHHLVAEMTIRAREERERRAAALAPTLHRCSA